MSGRHFTPVKIRVSLPADYDPMFVTGWQVVGIPGLAVQLGISDGWVVTHIGSGRAIGYGFLPTVDRAADLLMELADLGDWTLPAADLKPLAVACLPVVERFGLQIRRPAPTEPPH